MSNGLDSELLISYKLAKLGFRILKPIGVYPYDLVVELNGKFLRVQVKSTSYVFKAINRYSVLCCYGSSNKIRYTKEHIDIFAVYIKPHDTWYFIPVEAVNTKKIFLKPVGDCSFNRYKEFWDIFHGSPHYIDYSKDLEIN